MEEPNVHGTSGQPSTASESCEAQQLDETQEPDRASEIAGDPKASIDTAAPIDSVKGAATKFGVGGAVDWKEKSKQLQDELDQVQEEVTEYQKRTHETEAGRAQALQELGTTVNAADELRLGLEMARAEQTLAREQAELADLRLEEVRRAASERAAAKAKAELDDVRERRAAALAELRAARTEAEALEKVRARAAAEASAALARARRRALLAVSSS